MCINSQLENPISVFRELVLDIPVEDVLATQFANTGNTNTGLSGSLRDPCQVKCPKNGASCIVSRVFAYLRACTRGAEREKETGWEEKLGDDRLSWTDELSSTSIR